MACGFCFSYKYNTIQIKLRWALFVTYTIIQSITSSEMCFSAFNPSQCTHTWSSGQLTLQHPGSSWGFGALLKGLTSVMDTSCQSRDSNPQPWVTIGFKSNTLSIRPRLHDCVHSAWLNKCTQLNGRLWLVYGPASVGMPTFMAKNSPFELTTKPWLHLCLLLGLVTNVCKCTVGLTVSSSMNLQYNTPQAEIMWWLICCLCHHPLPPVRWLRTGTLFN